MNSAGSRESERVPGSIEGQRGRGDHAWRIGNTHYLREFVGSRAACDPVEVTTMADPRTGMVTELVTEVWRLGQRLNAVPITNDRIHDSFERLRRVLEEHGATAWDPTGTAFHDGMNVEVIASPQGESGPLVIAEVLRPGVLIDGVCVSSPQVILGDGRTRE